MNTVDNKKENNVASPVASQAKAPAKPMMHRPKPGMRPMRRGADKPSDDIEQRIVDLARVTRVMAGGKRMKFRACMIIGDRKGRVGMGLAKGIDVSAAIAKAVTQARKHLTKVTIVDGTIPHAVTVKEKSAKKGSGIKAGGVVRIILDLAGIKDATAKILGAGNKINNSRATLKALSSFVPKSRSIKTKTDEAKKIVSADKIIVANKKK
mgnify:CR=1 FL=1